MYKKLLSLVLALLFCLSVAGVSMAAVRCKGKIVEIKGNELVIKCKNGKEVDVTVKNVKKFKVGEKVRVHGNRVIPLRHRRMMMEGC